MSATPQLAGKRVLIVEDEYFVADDLRRAFLAAGAEVVGPVGSLEAALAVARAAPCDAAILDINLDGEMSYPVADYLIDVGVPVVLATGYDDRTVPSRLAGVPRLAKPFNRTAAVRAICEITLRA